MIDLETLSQETNLRKVWAKEDKDFTPWLAENLNYVGGILEMDLELVERESKVGGFSADILAKVSETDKYVVIENQLEDSNHDHLGKLLTYASGKNAVSAVWIVKKARDEHRQAIEWLNENTVPQIGFYLLEIELWQIGNSKLAPKFNVVVRPNEWAKAHKPSSDASDIQVAQIEYWQAFNDYVRNKTFAKPFPFRSAKPQEYYDISVGDSRFHIYLEMKKLKNEVRTGLFIPNDKETYKTLLEHKSDIVSSLGCNGSDIEWKDSLKSSRFFIKKSVDLSDSTQWPNAFQWYIDSYMAIKDLLPKIV